jgi:hypothetical protein
MDTFVGWRVHVSLIIHNGVAGNASRGNKAKISTLNSSTFELETQP